MAERFPDNASTLTTPVSVEPIPITGMPLNLEADFRRQSWLEETASNVGSACRIARDYSVNFVTGARDKTKKISEQLADRAAKLKNEQPLQVLGAIAGIAFVLGVMTRIWRSSRYE